MNNQFNLEIGDVVKINEKYFLSYKGINFKIIRISKDGFCNLKPLSRSYENSIYNNNWNIDYLVLSNEIHILNKKINHKFLNDK